MRLLNGRIVNDSAVKPVSLPPVPVTGDLSQARFNQAVANAIQGIPEHATAAVGDAVRSAVATAVDGLTDDRIPPAPSGLTATGAFQNILLEWNYADYDYHGYTRVFRANVNDFTQAAVLANAGGKLWADNVGSNASYYYWVANVSKAGVQSAINAVAGVHGTTLPDVTYLLTTLTGQIAASSLTAALSTRINLIDGPATTPGTVAAQVKTETDARTTADSALSSRIDTVTATANGNTATIATEQTTRANADTALSTQITTVQSTLNGSIASVQTQATANANAITGLQAQYTIKVDAGGHVAGIGLASSSTASQILMLADQFAIVIPSVNGGTPAVPFVATTINGVAAVGITSAFIADAAITNAKIGNLAVDNAKIAGGITADKLSVGSLSAVSATIGLLRTASTGARTEIADNQIRVYDSAGTLRVRMGVW